MEKINCDFGPAAMTRIPGARSLIFCKDRLRAAGLLSAQANEAALHWATVWAKKDLDKILIGALNRPVVQTVSERH